MHARQVCLTSPFSFITLRQSLAKLLNCPGWTETWNYLVLDSESAGITGMHTILASTVTETVYIIYHIHIPYWTLKSTGAETVSLKLFDQVIWSVSGSILTLLGVNNNKSLSPDSQILSPVFSKNNTLQFNSSVSKIRYCCKHVGVSGREAAL